MLTVKVRIPGLTKGIQPASFKRNNSVLAVNGDVAEILTTGDNRSQRLASRNLCPLKVE